MMGTAGNDADKIAAANAYAAANMGTAVTDADKISAADAYAAMMEIAGTDTVKIAAANNCAAMMGTTWTVWPTGTYDPANPTTTDGTTGYPPLNCDADFDLEISSKDAGQFFDELKHLPCHEDKTDLVIN